MKDLFILLGALLLAAPAMAFYPEGGKVILPATSFYDEVTLICQAPKETEDEYEKEDVRKHYQYCASADRLTGLFVTDDEDFAAYDMEEDLSFADTVKDEEVLVNVTRQCAQTEEYVHFLKYRVGEVDDPFREGMEGFMMELMGRAVYKEKEADNEAEKYDKKGYMALMRFYNPDLGAVENEDEKKLIEQRNQKKRDFVLFDARTKADAGIETDFNWLCEQTL